MDKAYMYFRVSTDEQDARNQERDVMILHNELCPDTEIIKFYEEGSAWQDNNRPVFRKAIKDFTRDKDAKYFLAWDFDRIYRDRKKFVSLMRELYTAKKIVSTYRQKYMLKILQIPEPWNEIIYELLIQIYGETAEEESRKRSDRVKAAYERKKRQGKAETWGRPRTPPQVIHRVKELKSQGLSIRAIQTRLKQERIKLSTGKISEILGGSRGPGLEDP